MFLRVTRGNNKQLKKKHVFLSEWSLCMSVKYTLKAVNKIQFNGGRLIVDSAQVLRLQTLESLWFKP